MANWFKRLRGGNAAQGQPGPKQDAAEAKSPVWIEANENPWGVRILDVRPLTLTTTSTSRDPHCATNAVSFVRDDGTSFVGVHPAGTRAVPSSLRYRIDRYLADGALFLPTIMEHKWAIYLHRGRVIFIRSWLRQVSATAEVEIADGLVTITQINGSFVGQDEHSAFTIRAADYLLRTHALGTAFPAPLPHSMESDPRAAALWCMSAFGSMAEFATSEAFDAPPPPVPMRTHSLLHIAVARGDAPGVVSQLDAGVPADLLAKDGLAPLHWALAGNGFTVAELLLQRGSPVDARSTELATPLMNAVQSKKLDWVDFLLTKGADANAADRRGFTALHRAAEMGLTDIARRLLDGGAEKDLSAEGHTAHSLAQARNQTAVINLLTGGS